MTELETLTDILVHGQDIAVPLLLTGRTARLAELSGDGANRIRGERAAA